jgi:hypothetical protein
MKNIKKTLFFSIIGLMVAVSACKEDAPAINFTNNGGGGTVTNRKVLVEEFTGVRCVNCPGGSQEIQNLITNTNHKLIAVSIHTGSFSRPYNTSTQDLTLVPEGDNLNTLLGPVTGYPAAVINRKIFSGEPGRPQTVTKWAGSLATELAIASKVELKITPTYNASTRELSFSVDASNLGGFSAANPLSLGVYITEDSITSAQLLPAGIDDNYIHRHVLRKALPDYQGTPIASLPQTKNFQYTIPATWNVNRLNIVAFLYNNNQANNNLEVIQVEEKKVK